MVEAWRIEEPWCGGNTYEAMRHSIGKHMALVRFFRRYRKTLPVVDLV